MFINFTLNLNSIYPFQLYSLLIITIIIINSIINFKSPNDYYSIFSFIDFNIMLVIYSNIKITP